MTEITQYLKQNGYSTVDDSWYSKIALWFSWYKGKVFQFHNYRQYNGSNRIKRTRKSLGMAKRICEDWANLELNEKCEIVLQDEQQNKLVKQVLAQNHFSVRGNQLIELSYALGTGAFVEYLDNENVCIDYIRGGMIYPINWDNGTITECAFASVKTTKTGHYIYLNIHEKGENGSYIIKNRMFRKNGNCLTPSALPEGMAEEYSTGTNIPMFQIIMPNLANNIDPDCPMGISVYANAIDQLEGIDLIYDSYCNEFRLGKKRIMVPVTMSQVMQEESGMVSPLFDDSDTEFYAVNMAEAEKPFEINMELRTDAHDKALKTALNLFSESCGLGNDRYSFEQNGVKTATEVISEKSDLFQNLKKHELVLEKALADMVKAILVLSGNSSEQEITINFDDSIIEDTTAEKTQYLQEIRDGIRKKWEYRVRFFGETEEEAKANIDQQESNNGLMGFGDE